LKTPNFAIGESRSLKPFVKEAMNEAHGDSKGFKWSLRVVYPNSIAILDIRLKKENSSPSTS